MKSIGMLLQYLTLEFYAHESLSEFREETLNAIGRVTPLHGFY